MKSIIKFPLETVNYQEITLKHNAELLDVQVQNNLVVLWALVNLDQPRSVTRIIRIVETDQLIVNEGLGQYVATYQHNNGTSSFHVFDGGERITRL